MGEGTQFQQVTRKKLYRVEREAVGGKTLKR